MKRKYFSVAILAVLVGITSCRQDEKLSQKTDVINKVIGAKKTIVDENGQTLTPVEGEATEENQAPTTRITYTEPKVTLPDAVEGTIVKHSFEFQNTGNEPLFIYSAQGSCGCTVPNYPKEPIAPGQKGKIDIEFNSEGRPGSNTKTVTVNANTNPAVTELSFTVKVNPKK